MQWPAKISTELYLSFEDALWSLLPRLGYKKGSKLLIPNFYCIDVVQNIEAHGYVCAYYKLNPDFTYNLSGILAVVEKEQPDIFIEFQPDGLRTSLLSDIERKLHPRMLIISDRVHSIMTPQEEYIPHSDRHLYLGSFRKVTMLPGTIAVFTRAARSTKQQSYPWGYLFRALILWWTFIIQIKLSYLLSSPQMMKLAMRTLTVHDDLIGDSFVSAPIPSWMGFAYEFFDIEKISLCKREQIFIYLKELEPIISKNEWIWLPHYLDESYDNLRSFPLITTYEKGILLEKELEKQQIYRTRQLIGSPWSLKHSLFFFPLGPHLTKNDVQQIARRIKKTLTTLA